MLAVFQYNIGAYSGPLRQNAIFRSIMTSNEEIGAQHEGEKKKRGMGCGKKKF